MTTETVTECDQPRHRRRAGGATPGRLDQVLDQRRLRSSHFEYVGG